MVFGSHSWDNVHTCVHIIIVLCHQVYLDHAHPAPGECSWWRRRWFRTSTTSLLMEKETPGETTSKYSVSQWMCGGVCIHVPMDHPYPQQDVYGSVCPLWPSYLPSSAPVKVCSCCLLRLVSPAREKMLVCVFSLIAQKCGYDTSKYALCNLEALSEDVWWLLIHLQMDHPYP